MFGIGMQEMVIIGVLLLIVFGPSKLPLMARDVGKFVGEARRAVDDFKRDIASEDFMPEEEEVGQEPHEIPGPEEAKPEEDATDEEDAVDTRSVPPAA